MRVARRSLLKAAAATAGMGAIGFGAGCTREPEDRPRQGLAELAIMSGLDESRGRQRDALRRQWARRHPGAQAHFIEIGGVADAHRSQMVAQAQSGRGGVDIYNLDVTWTAEFAQAGYLRPLEVTGLDLDGFLEQPLQTCWYDGKLWALPFNTDAGLLYYRSDLIPEELAPTDWGGIEMWTRQVLATPDDRTGLEAGYAGQLADYEGLTVNAFEMIWFEHGEVVTGDWRDPGVGVDSGAVEDALRRLARVATQETPQLILPAAAEFDEAATTNSFREGKVLFMRNWPVAYRSLDGARRGDLRNDGVAPAPEFKVRRLPGPSVLGGQNLAIARDSANPELAQQLIGFLTSEPSQRTLFGEGGLPATRSAVYDDPAIVAEHPYAPDLREAIRMAKQRPVTPYYSRFSEVFRRNIRQALRRGGELPDGFARQLADAMRGLRR